MRVAKTKALISFAVTAKLICVFVFAYAKRRFSHDEAQIIAGNKFLLRPNNVLTTSTRRRWQVLVTSMMATLRPSAYYALATLTPCLIRFYMYEGVSKSSCTNVISFNGVRYLTKTCVIC